MTVKGGKKCHICLERKLTIITCDFCGHNTCINLLCLTAVLLKRMCWKCQVDPEHRTLMEVPVA